MNQALTPVEPGDKASPFFPNHMFVEALIAFLTLLALALLALVWQAPLEEIANPGDSAYVPRPEWYFLFVFQLLKYFEGNLTIIGTVIGPALTGLILLLWPFLDRGEETRLRKRPFSAAVGVGSLSAMAVLTGMAVLEDSDLRMDLPLITAQDLVDGQDIFNRFCILCHGMEGVGGYIAPDLTEVGSRVNRVYIERVVINPDIVSQTTVMSRIPLNDEERHAVSAFLSRKRNDPRLEPGACAPTAAQGPGDEQRR